jgi:hypothetical protein
MSPATMREIYLEDRSGADLDDKCGMAYWWNRLWLQKGARPDSIKGLVPVNEPLALAIGRVIHEDFHWIGTANDIRPEALEERVAGILAPITAEDKHQRAKMEILYRRLGWIVAWALYIEPHERELWETVALEKELILDRDPLWVQVTPDRLQRSRNHGYLRYLEFKTTISVNRKWMDSWRHAIQLHTSLAAINEELARTSEGTVRHAVIVGLQKGYTSQVDGRLMHPYVWAFYNQKTDAWTSDYTKARSQEWIPMPVWEYPGGIVKWVQELGKEVAQGQFPRSSPVCLDERLLNDWVLRRTARQKLIRNVEDKCRDSETTRSIYFEKRTRNCRPAFGDSCPYELLCHNATANEDPLATRNYIPRIPHHELEIIGLDL